MEIQSVSPEIYEGLFPTPSHIYNSGAFNELNRHKCDSVEYLVFKDSNGTVRFGIILGDTGEELKSPFSAPFGGFEERGIQRLNHYLEAAEALKLYAGSKGRRLTITLPPYIYNRHSHLNKQYGALLDAGFELVYSDYGHYFPKGIFPDLMCRMNSAARNKLRNAMANGFGFECYDSGAVEAVKRVYGVIEKNRSYKHYQLHMSLDDVISTVSLVRADFMILTLDDVDVAAAMVYHVTDNVVQVIYWGDLPGYSRFRPMNMLAYKLVEYYSESGKTIDIGPSSSNGIPSLGLCDFKESVGCGLTLKPTFRYG